MEFLGLVTVREISNSLQKHRSSEPKCVYILMYAKLLVWSCELPFPVLVLVFIVVAIILMVIFTLYVIIIIVMYENNRTILKGSVIVMNPQRICSAPQLYGASW